MAGVTGDVRAQRCVTTRGMGLMLALLVGAMLCVAPRAVAADAPTFNSLAGTADSQWFENLTDQERDAVVAAVAAGRSDSGDVSLPGLSQWERDFAKAFHKGEADLPDDAYGLESVRYQLFRLRQIAGVYPNLSTLQSFQGVIGDGAVYRKDGGSEVDQYLGLRMSGGGDTLYAKLELPAPAEGTSHEEWNWDYAGGYKGSGVTFPSRPGFVWHVTDGCSYRAIYVFGADYGCWDVAQAPPRRYVGDAVNGGNWSGSWLGIDDMRPTGVVSSSQPGGWGDTKAGDGFTFLSYELPSAPSAAQIETAITSYLESGDGAFARSVFDWAFDVVGDGPIPESIDLAGADGPMPTDLTVNDLNGAKVAAAFATVDEMCDALVTFSGTHVMEPPSTANDQWRACETGRLLGETPLEALKRILATLGASGAAGLTWYLLTHEEDEETSSPTPPRPPSQRPAAPLGWPDTGDLASDLQTRPGNMNLDAEQAEDLANDCAWWVGRSGADGLDECERLPIFVTGNNAEEAARHDMRALASNPAWAVLNYEYGAGKEQVQHNRGWYKGSDPNGDPYECARDPSMPAVNFDTQCDEYPLYATEQGGSFAATTPHLETIKKDDNILQGGMFGAFPQPYACNLQSGTIQSTQPTSNARGGSPFIGLPIVTEPPAPPVPTGYICA